MSGLSTSSSGDCWFHLLVFLPGVRQEGRGGGGEKGLMESVFSRATIIEEVSAPITFSTHETAKAGGWSRRKHLLLVQLGHTYEFCLGFCIIRTGWVRVLKQGGGGLKTKECRDVSIYTK